MTFELPKLPYDLTALEPHISKKTLEFHYGKHHQAYVNTLNKLTEGKPEAKKSLEELIQTAEGKLFNQAAQVWNHTFYWHSMSPKGGGAPKGTLEKEIKNSFGSVDDFKKKFSEAAGGVFGSGWAWVVKNKDGKLEIASTKDADNPVRTKGQPILTCDVWEHAYYLDYQNARPKYLEAWWNTVNWDFAEANLQGVAESVGAK